MLLCERSGTAHHHHDLHPRHAMVATEPEADEACPLHLNAHAALLSCHPGEPLRLGPDAHPLRHPLEDGGGLFEPRVGDAVPGHPAAPHTAVHLAHLEESRAPSHDGLLRVGGPVHPCGTAAPYLQPLPAGGLRTRGEALGREASHRGLLRRERRHGPATRWYLAARQHASRRWGRPDEPRRRSGREHVAARGSLGPSEVGSYTGRHVRLADVREGGQGSR
mmetsp:Transcript_126308/g.269449  ORF Transcript_126308/g.269449 Transcript_126308/m.269449 type:complete len:221 (-) Transcript_126308:412-1074(-)